MGIVDNLIKNDNVKEKGKSLLENLANALINKDVIALSKIFCEILGSPFFIREEIFWENFKEYIDNACSNEDDLKKLSIMLAEDGNSYENAKRIIKIIDDVGTRKKARYVSNLTRACCTKKINLREFFKLSQCIVRLTDEDLDFLCNNINNEILKDDEEYIDDFRYCGLMKEVNGGFAYTKRAYYLKKYSLVYGEYVEIPEIPVRQNISFATDEAVDEMLNEIFGDEK